MKCSRELRTLLRCPPRVEIAGSIRGHVFIPDGRRPAICKGVGAPPVSRSRAFVPAGILSRRVRMGTGGEHQAAGIRLGGAQATGEAEGVSVDAAATEAVRMGLEEGRWRRLLAVGRSTVANRAIPCMMTTASSRASATKSSTGIAPRCRSNGPCSRLHRGTCIQSTGSMWFPRIPTTTCARVRRSGRLGGRRYRRRGPAMLRKFGTIRIQNVSDFPTADPVRTAWATAIPETWLPAFCLERSVGPSSVRARYGAGAMTKLTAACTSETVAPLPWASTATLKPLAMVGVQA